MSKWDAKTIMDIILEWDAGNTIWSIEMGGLGPGYEQAIQLLFVELVRDMKDTPLPTDETFGEWGNETVTRIDKTCGGFSGAQVDAAKMIAYRMLRDGPQKFYQSIPKDRRIQVSKFFPHHETIGEAV